MLSALRRGRGELFLASGGGGEGEGVIHVLLRAQRNMRLKGLK